MKQVVDEVISWVKIHLLQLIALIIVMACMWMLL